ncbi:MAG: hypothetical protein ISR72_12045 [Methylobacter sp.]|nr:hypothetical protein [Methylobacter sp.]
MDDRVIAAIKQVPRHEFLPADIGFLAYENGPVSIGSVQSISRTHIIALMSDLLETEFSDILWKSASVPAIRQPYFRDLLGRFIRWKYWKNCPEKYQGTHRQR